MIAKQDKDRLTAINYPANSLKNCLAKILKTVVKNFVMEQCENENTSAETQRTNMKHRCSSLNSLSTLLNPSSGSKLLVWYAWMSKIFRCSITPRTRSQTKFDLARIIQS